MRAIVTLLISLSAYGFVPTDQQRGSGVSMSLPIKKHSGLAPRKPKGLNRLLKTTAIGLGDDQDIQYSVDMSLGGVDTILVLDTGSSDLWSISSDCTSVSCGDIEGEPLIQTSSFNSSGLDFSIDYGDSIRPSFASGVILSGTVGLAGTTLDNQFLGAVNSTDTLTDGYTGIFGVGFHTLSSIMVNLLTQGIPDTAASITADTINSKIAVQGPFLSRMITQGQLDQPMFTITLQRDSVDIGGNIGQFTIGKLPDSVSNDSLTWVAVRLYSESQGGIAGPSDSPNEHYPFYWEVPIDDVLLNGQTLPKPDLPSGIRYSALIDSGTSILLGPENTVDALYSALSLQKNFDSDLTPDINCSEPVQLTYVIGGKQFPIDPRDFLGAQDVWECTVQSVGPTDPPSVGSLFSWILGDPFMKSNFVAFYFGNLTHPSVDPPRIGFLSTVPTNAAELYSSAVNAAQRTGLPIISSEAPPTGTLTATSTNSVGVEQANAPSSSSSSGGSSGDGGSSGNGGSPGDGGSSGDGGSPGDGGSSGDSGSGGGSSGDSRNGSDKLGLASWPLALMPLIMFSL